MIRIRIKVWNSINRTSKWWSSPLGGTVESVAEVEVEVEGDKVEGLAEEVEVGVEGNRVEVVAKFCTSGWIVDDDDDKEEEEESWKGREAETWDVKHSRR